MTDEVTRLRRLRKTALKVRALAAYLTKVEGDSQELAAHLNWRIARIATGRLRSHPYANYQRDQGLLERGLDRVAAYLLAVFANVRGRQMRIFLEALNAASRELDDTRALTLSADLSDALGRAQQSMRELIAAVGGQVPAGSGKRAQTEGADGQASSPYLAL
jgi:hypothetical protein